MDVILVDTSVLVNFFKGNATKSTRYLTANISNILIATCPVVTQEILQGVINDKDFSNTISFLDDVIQLRNDPYELAIEAASLYRYLRKVGVTIRKPNDCLIAAYAIKNQIYVLHDDRDFDHIAAHSKLKVIK